MTGSPDARTEPMLAKAADAVPDADAAPGGYSYEPKWDGFRGIVEARAADDEPRVVIGSRGGKTLERYFPELVAELAAQLPPGTVIDGEIVVRRGEPGAERLDWEALSQRIHPAESRIRRLAEETPASFVAFDLLATASGSLLDAPFRERRAELEALLADARPPLHLTQTTADAALARRWLVDFEGAGLDGVVAKPLEAPYSPGKRTMIKVKHHRTAEAVLLGYRVHTSGQGVGSLLLGLYVPDADGEPVLRNIGGASAFTNARRIELVEELATLVERDEAGEAVRGETDRSRFSGSKDVSFVRLRPERVVEVAYDQMEGARFRHAVRFLRWRPDRDPSSCTVDQLDLPDGYDLARVLT